MNEIYLPTKEQCQANLMALHRQLQEMSVRVKRADERPRTHMRPGHEIRPVMQRN